MIDLRRARVACLAVAVAIAVVVVAARLRGSRPTDAPTHGPDAGSRVPSSPAPAPARDDARDLIEAGLATLASAQNDDGSFGGQDSKHVRIGLSAIACLAFLADGNSEHRGRYHDVTTRALRYLIGCSIREGERKGYLGRSDVDTRSQMHGHGYATLALAEAFGTYGVRRRYASTSSQLKEIIHDAVDVIVRSQSRSGGWFYEPFDEINDEGSITVCMVQALRAARNAGFHVPSRSIERAVDYVKRSQNEDGSIRYRLTGNEQTSFELTAAGCSTLAAAGSYYEPAVRNARDYLWNRRFDDFLGHDHRFPYYGLFYAVQALWFDYDRGGDRRFQRCFPRIVDWYRQRWDPEARLYRHTRLPLHKEMEFGDAYRTAFATLTLQIPNWNLPIFQR